MSSHTNDAGAAGGDGTAGTRSDGVPAPIDVEHEIEAMGCDAQRIGPEFLIQPTLECRSAPEYDAVTNRTFVCEVADYCTSHADCKQQPFGRCRGSPTTRCAYPMEPCDADEECVSHPNGSCSEPLGDWRCTPERECWPIRRECYYPSEECESDAACGGGGGVCEKLVLFARCLYQGCSADSDCGDGQSCACSNGQNACVPADCTADGDCASGEHCRLEQGCFSAEGFHCTTTADTCQSGGDCATGRCEYRAGRFQCHSDPCPND